MRRTPRRRRPPRRRIPAAYSNTATAAASRAGTGCVEWRVAAIAAQLRTPEPSLANVICGAPSGASPHSRSRGRRQSPGKRVRGSMRRCTDGDSIISTIAFVPEIPDRRSENLQAAIRRPSNRCANAQDGRTNQFGFISRPGTYESVSSSLSCQRRTRRRQRSTAAASDRRRRPVTPRRGSEIGQGAYRTPSMAATRSASWRLQTRSMIPRITIPPAPHGT